MSFVEEKDVRYRCFYAEEKLKPLCKEIPLKAAKSKKNKPIVEDRGIHNMSCIIMYDYINLNFIGEQRSDY